MTVISDMRGILRTDAEFMSYLPGGVLDQPITPKTPGVWDEDPVTAIKTLKRCAVLLEPQAVDSPVGLNPGRRIDTDLWPELYLYGPRSALETLYAADTRAMELLHGQVIGLATIDAMGFRAAPLESDELPGDIWHIFRRYRVQMSHHIQEV